MYPWLEGLSEALFEFVFLYPLAMSYVWMVGALIFWWNFERKSPPLNKVLELRRYPKVAIVIPCFNEEADLEETIANTLEHDYPAFEVIAINDGSTDRTGEILDRLAAADPRLRVIHQARNQGKAMALNMAAVMTDAELLLCIDGDALLSPDAARRMVYHFLKAPRVGAVTGNPRVRTRSSLLGLIQVGEFSSIIGLLKRAQRAYGRLFTASGVITMFRRSALHEVGYWSKDMLTEDTDISWKLQLAHWSIHFEPSAVCWILMPETLKGLWRQRLRWAMGGCQMVLRYASMWGLWRKRRMWPIYVEFMASLLWSYAMLATLILWVLSVFQLPLHGFEVDAILPRWTGVIVGTTCLLQIGLALWLDRPYDKRLFRTLFWAIWYPLAYWTINMLTSVVAFPRVLMRRQGARATWVSPDRGIRTQPKEAS